MTEERFDEMMQFYKVARKQEREYIAQYLYYYIDEHININNNYIEEIKKYNNYDNIQDYIKIEKIEAKNETLKNIKEYILLYVDIENIKSK